MRPTSPPRGRSCLQPRPTARLRLERLEGRSLPAVVNWTLGADGDFANANAWTVVGTTPPQNRVPGPTDDAVIPANFLVTSMTEQAVNSLLATNFRILGGSFTLNAQATASALTGLVLVNGAGLLVAGGNQPVFVNGSILSGTIAVGSGSVLAFSSGTNSMGAGASVSGAGQVLVTGGSLQVNAPVSVANLSLSAGTLAGTSVLTLIGQSAWSGGTMEGAGTTAVAAGATLALTGAAKQLSQRPLEVFGTANHSSGTINFTGGSLTVRPGGAYNLLADVDIGGTGGAVTNQGLFVKTSPTGTGASTISRPFNNAGTLRVDGGTLALTFGGSSTGAFVLASGTELVFGAGNSLGAGATVSGAGQVSVTGGTLQANAPVSIANLNLSGGTLGGTGTFTLTGTPTWSGGSMIGTGTTAVAAGATLALTGTAKQLSQRTLEVAGTVNHSGGQLDLIAAALIIRPGGAYNLLADVHLGSAGGTVTNQGRFIKTSPTGTGDRASSVLTTFNNAGTVQVDSGTLSLVNGGAGTGTFALASGGVLHFVSGTYVLGAGATVSGPGSVFVGGGSLLVSAPVSIPYLTLSGGTLGGTGALTLTGTSTWSGGAMGGTGTTTVAAGATLALTGAAKQLSQRTLEVFGTANHSGGQLDLTPAAVLTVRPGGAYNLLADVDIGGTGGAVTNQGLFVKTSPTGTGASTISRPFNNAGTLRVDGGTLVPNVSYTQSAGATLIAAGATLQSNVQLDVGALAGDGTLVGNLTVTGTGTVSPGTSPGRLTVNGSLVLQPAGALTAELNGPTAATQYDQLRVTGSVILGGALNVILGYAPAAGDSFTILDNTGPGAITGTFAGLPEGAAVSGFTISYVGGTGNDVTLTRVSGGPTVRSVVVNDGTAQRSMVTRLAVTFTTAVTFAGNPADAFQLVRAGGAAVGLSATTATVGGVTVATLTFSGPETENGSLKDGVHALTVLSAQVNGGLVGGNVTSTLYRLYGDANGDRRVDNLDFFQFRTTFGLTAAQPGYLAYFDFDTDGDVDNADFFQFRPRFGSVLP